MDRKPWTGSRNPRPLENTSQHHELFRLIHVPTLQYCTFTLHKTKPRQVRVKAPRQQQHGLPFPHLPPRRWTIHIEGASPRSGQHRTLTLKATSQTNNKTKKHGSPGPPLTRAHAC
ncbi:unnamed protein product, partial [Ectocarpus sp. 12 AP-2014]